MAYNNLAKLSHTPPRKPLTQDEGKTCPYCQEAIDGKAHVDHIVPKKLGGIDHNINYCICCAACNLRKNAKHPFVWFQSTGHLWSLETIENYLARVMYLNITVKENEQCTQ